MEITRVREEELRQLADEQGPLSAPATILQRLSEKRARDRQVFAWQVGSYYFIGPAPDAETELAMVDLALGDDDEDKEEE